MAKTAEAPATKEGTTVFEPDRFAWADQDTLELTGRWFGVRGRRFMRPSLILIRDDGEIRLLADLEHKPWVAEDGEPWAAAFPCTGSDLDGVQQAELTVSPDLTIKLDAPGAGRSRAVRPAKRRKPAPPEPSGGAKRPKPTQPERTAEHRELEELRNRVESLTREFDERRGRHEADLVDAQKAATDALVARDGTADERDRLIVERDALALERDEAGERGERAEAERDAALLARDRALADRAQAQAERDAALADQAHSASDRDELANADARIQSEHDQAVSSHGAQLVMRNATAGGPGRTRAPLWFSGAIATAIIVVAALVVAMVAR
jgi:hypothetical protein